MRFPFTRIPLISLLGIVFLNGCGAGLPLVTSESQTAVGVIQGHTFGGQQPVVGMHIYLLQAATSGYGAASTSLLTNTTGTVADGTGAYYVTTNTSGFFSLSGKYTCTVGGQVYLYGVGGNPGAGTNSAAGMMAVLGQCPSSGSLASTVPSVWMNEVSTVAAAYALAGFATDATHVADDEGVSGNTTAAQAQTGMANAFAAATNLADIATGVARATTPNGNGTVPQTELNALANILAACVNSSGPTSTPCSTLLSKATTDGTTSGTQPTDTATAAINIAHNPAANVTALFGIIPATRQFSPSLTSAPNAWNVALTYTGGGITNPYQMAVDASGSVWVVNNTTASISKLSSLGVPASTTSYTGGGLASPTGVAVDLSGNAWVINTSSGVLSEFSSTGTPMSATGYTGGGLAVGTAGVGIAVDALNNVWTVNGNYNRLSQFSNSGSPISPSGGYTGGGLSSSQNLAIDASGNAWATNYGGSLSKFSSAGVAISGSGGYTGGGLSGVNSVSFDAAGNVWTTSKASSKLNKFTSAGVAITGSAGYTGGGLSNPNLCMVDGAGSVWAVNNTASVSQFSSSGVAISGFLGYTGAGGTLLGLALDGSGNVWVSSYASNSLTEFVGAAAPVVTPQAAAVKFNKLGTRP